MRIYDYSRDDEPWFMPVFFTTISFTNEGAKAGVVNGLRLRVHHAGVEPADNYQTFVPLVALDRPLGVGWDSRKSREKWLDKSPEWLPFVVLPKATVDQHLVLQSDAWPGAITHDLIATLELHTDGRSDWRSIDSWNVRLSRGNWDLAGQGMPVPAVPSSYIDSGARQHPDNLTDSVAEQEPRD